MRRQERLLVLGFAAKRADVGKEMLAAVGKGLCQRQPGAPGGEDDGDVAEPERAGAQPASEQRAVHNAIGERREERRMRADRIQPRARRCGQRLGKEIRLVGIIDARHGGI
jgi:hypothetical protein